MVSQTVEYALRAMSCLAACHGGAATSVVIARAARVPHGYLSKIMRALVCASLVKSSRGRHGGFVLARDPALISLLDIVNAVDPIRRIHACPLDNPFHHNLCPLHQCLDDALAHIEHRFTHTTLAAVLDRLPNSCSTLFQLAHSPTNNSRP